MAAVIETLRDEHRNIGRLLDALEHQVAVFARAETPDYDVISGIADYFLDFPDLCHHPKENVIYQRLSEKHPQEAARIGDLLLEHKAVHDHAVRFRDTVQQLLSQSDIARAEIVAAAEQFIDTERRHMQREEAQFLPLADRVLNPEDWAWVEARLADGSDSLFGERIETHFSHLRDRLLAWESEFAEDSAPAHSGAA